MARNELPARQDAFVAVERAINLLSTFTPERRELTFTQIATELGLAKSPAHRLISTLERHGLLRKTLTEKYTLGTKLLEWGSLAAESIDLLSAGGAEAEQLAAQTRETITLVEWDGHRQIYVAKHESPRAVRIVSRVGTVREPYYALGKVILAYLPPAEVEGLLPETLPRFTENSITDRQEFVSRLRQVRDLGYGIDDQEFILGGVGVGAPVFRHGGHVAGLLGVLAPSVRMEPDVIAQIGQWTMERAAAISRNLGFAGGCPGGIT